MSKKLKEKITPTQFEKDLNVRLKVMEQNQENFKKMFALHGKALEKVLKGGGVKGGGKPSMDLGALAKPLEKLVEKVGDYLLKSNEHTSSDGYKVWQKSLEKNALEMSNIAVKRANKELDLLDKRASRFDEW